MTDGSTLPASDDELRLLDEYWPAIVRLWREEALRGQQAPTSTQQTPRANGAARCLAAESFGHRIQVRRRQRRPAAADEVVDLLAEVVAVRGSRAFLMVDSGPELVASADSGYCRRVGFAIRHDEPGGARQNPSVDSFNGGMRDGLLPTEEFSMLLEAQLFIGAWRSEHERA